MSDKPKYDKTNICHGVNEIHLGNTVISPKGITTYILTTTKNTEYPYIRKIKGRNKDFSLDTEFVDCKKVRSKFKEYIGYISKPFDENFLYEYKRFYASYKDNFIVEGYFYIIDGLIFEKSRAEIFELMGIGKKGGKK